MTTLHLSMRLAPPPLKNMHELYASTVHPIEKIQETK